MTKPTVSGPGSSGLIPDPATVGVFMSTTERTDTLAKVYLDRVHLYRIGDLTDPRRGFISPECQRGQVRHLRDTVVNSFMWPSAPWCPACRRIAGGQ